jgi:hypothetical protein
LVTGQVNGSSKYCYAPGYLLHPEYSPLRGHYSDEKYNLIRHTMKPTMRMAYKSAQKEIERSLGPTIERCGLRPYAAPFTLRSRAFDLARTVVMQNRTSQWGCLRKAAMSPLLNSAALRSDAPATPVEDIDTGCGWSTLRFLYLRQNLV